MKLIVIDIENKAIPTTVVRHIKDTLDIETLVVPSATLEGPNYKYGNFSKAAFALEELLLATPDYWSKDKPFINVLLVWGNQHDLRGIEHLKSYQHTYNKDLIVFSTNNVKHLPWVFGNIVAVTKWAGSLFKVHPTMPTQRDKSGFTTTLEVPMWYATRIGLDVRAVNQLINVP
jgi:hypothetical protein